MENDKSWWSLRDIFELMPIGEDEGSIEDNMASIGVGLDDKLWRLERLHVQRDLTDLQVHDDPDDRDGLAKIDDLARALQRRVALPPMLGERGSDGRVALHDGRHRYNAYLAAGQEWAPVWVTPSPL
jgi:hypothetical protein